MIILSEIESQHNKHIENGGNTAILSMNQRQSVWLDNDKGAIGAVLLKTGQTTTFSGVLLYG